MMLFFECRYIDGYSRRITWLKSGYTSHSPEVIASYFVECTTAVGGYPSKLRTDCGTENTVIAAIQEWATANPGMGALCPWTKLAPRPPL